MKKAIVIGATSGIGRETAARLVEEGWMVGVTGRRVEALKSFKAEYGDNVHFMEMDVTKEDATVGLDELIGEMGAPDLLLYVSGVGYQNLELDMDKEIRTVKTNCEGLVRMVVHFINYVRNHQELYSADHEAHIAVVTSIAGTAGLGTAPSYSATKKMQQTYISALTQLVRMEGLPVSFTDIRPGFVATAILNPDKRYPMMMSLEKAADEVIKAICRKKRIYTFDWKFRILVFFWRLVPRFIWERLTWVKN